MIKTAEAYAKINISLDIVSRMADGYHKVLMVMQSVGLCDEVTVECVPGDGIYVDSGLPYLPNDERNIAAKAAQVFYEYTGIKDQKTFITIRKQIPVCAGLGGGSADGACVLRLLDNMFMTKLGTETLMALGGRIGSDIPFCVRGGTALAEGRGDILTELTPLENCWFVICKPQFAFSTPELFSKMRCEKIRARPDTQGILTALENGDLNGIARRMYNVFEDFLPRGKRDIDEIKYALLDTGALGAVMTGTGSAVLGLFASKDCAEKAFSELKPAFKECFVTHPVYYTS